MTTPATEMEEPTIETTNDDTADDAAATGGGLSELARQLRVLQAKNKAQAVEIDRLERQVKILTDLQDISVADLRDALTKACQAEAHQELQQRILSLEAQLAAAQQQHSSVNQEAALHQISTLQLRIGELEEVEQNQKDEISRLYNMLRENSEMKARLESTCRQQQAQIEELLAKQQQDSDEKEETVAETPQQLVIVEQQIEDGKSVLLQQQLDAANKQHGLRQAQYKARFLVQEERIHDLEQQLTSLYTAFEMLRQERAQEEETRKSLRLCLNDADAQVAKHLEQRPAFATTTKTTPSKQQPPQAPQTTAATVTPEPAVAVPVEEKKDDETSSIVLAGVLSFRGGTLKRWKKRNAALHVRFAHYELVLSEGLQVVKTFQLQVGVSEVKPFPRYPLAFTITINPYKASAAIVHAAACNENDYHDWMSALTEATTGISSAVNTIPSAPKTPETTTDESLEQVQSPDSTQVESDTSLSHVEESDLQAALEVSRREF